MTPVYEVTTKHTDRVLKDFITFKEQVTKNHTTFRLVMLTICDATLAYLGRGNALTYIFAVFAIVTFGFVLVRKHIAFKKLSKVDANYQKQTAIHFIFGESEFRVENPEARSEQRLKYGEVEFMYVDDTYFYINVNNEDLHMFPKTDFTLGDADGFYEFFTNKTGKTFQPVKLPWKIKLGIMKQAWNDMQNEAVEKNKK